MSKHTPGPWEARGKAIVARGSPRRNNAYNGRICNVQGAGEGDNKINATAKANARLIAAAPQMLEALEAAYDHICPDGDPLDAREFEVCGKIEAAIAAAKGEI